LSDYERVHAAADAVRARVSAVPQVGIVLGSGLGDFTRSLDHAVSIPYGQLPHWPASSVSGHAGSLIVGTVRGRTVVALSGRAHLYEGHDLRAVTFGVRVLGLLPVAIVILTNAAGAINAGFAPGNLMVIDDHINLTGQNPLVGPNDERFGPRFPDMSEIYSSRLRTIADQIGRESGLALQHGVYAGQIGPSYETPAESRYLRVLGADAVGMSTVAEAIVARHMGIEVLGISCITNLAPGVLPRPIHHLEVIETAHRVSAQFSLLLEGIIGQL
jgi:purine-nucleoside phosphorylase